MEYSEIKAHLDKETTYLSVSVTMGKTIWSIVQASGRFNYVSIRKVYPNPFGTVGREFETFDQAQEYYKTPAFKVALLMAENDFKIFYSIL